MKYKELSFIFRLSRSTIRKIVWNLIDTTTDRINDEYIPKGSPTSSKEFKNFPNAIGAIETTLIPIQKHDRLIEREYY